jgi:hypothetical protein
MLFTNCQKQTLEGLKMALSKMQLQGKPIALYYAKSTITVLTLALDKKVPENTKYTFINSMYCKYQ